MLHKEHSPNLIKLHFTLRPIQAANAGQGLHPTLQQLIHLPSLERLAKFATAAWLRLFPGGIQARLRTLSTSQSCVAPHIK